MTRARLVPVVAATVAAACGVLGGCTAPVGTSAAASSGTDWRADARAALVASLREHPSFPGIAVAMRGPGWSWRSAVGKADPERGTPLTPDTPFRVASVTKTFVAATVLRLTERGEVGLGDPVNRHLSASTVALLRSGGYDPARITVRQLLQHTSGLADYATLPAYAEAILAAPQRRWTPRAQVRFAMTHASPEAEPGEEFHYADTGFVLLGEIVRRRTGRPLAAAVRSVLRLDTLGMPHTYWETLEPAPRGEPARAHQFEGDWDGTSYDPSFDLYGGGGLVSTVDDLTRFWRALFGGRVFARPGTLALMTGAASPDSVDELGMGLFATRIGGRACFGHQGFWGTDVTYCPRSGVVVAITVNQAEGMERPVVALGSALHGLAPGRG